MKLGNLSNNLEYEIHGTVRIHIRRHLARTYSRYIKSGSNLRLPFVKGSCSHYSTLSSKYRCNKDSDSVCRDLYLWLGPSAWRLMGLGKCL